MEYMNEVNEKLGIKNVKRFYDEIEKGHIDKPTLQRIGIHMHEKVNGIFIFKEKTCEKLVHVGQYMLDKWYLEELFDKNVDGVTRFKDIYEKVGLHPLAAALNSENVLLNTGYSAGQTCILPGRVVDEKL